MLRVFGSAIPGIERRRIYSSGGSRFSSSGRGTSLLRMIMRAHVFSATVRHRCRPDGLHRPIRIGASRRNKILKRGAGRSARVAQHAAR